ncbi:MAG: hypothetical protein LAO30_22970 [Acidobacteriia bacterium]|nr:hypothetical protein [Terriglobia bacterium]
MMLRHLIFLYLWVAPHALLAVLAVVMFRSRRHREYPVFFGYLLFEILQFCLLFAMSRLFVMTRAGWGASAYVQIDLLVRAGSIAFRFGIIQEILEASVAHSASFRKTMAWMFRCSATLLALLAAVFIGSIYSWGVRDMILPVYAVRHTLNIVQCGLLAFVFVWYRFLGLKMQGFVVGITLGMGFVAGLEPLLDAVKDFRLVDSQIVDMATMGLYHVSVLIWLYFAIVQEELTSDSAVAALPDARKWVAELGRFTWL